MRLEIVRAVFLKELRETLRDRRSVAVMFGVPFVFYPLLAMSIASLSVSTAQRISAQTTRVAVENPAAAPHLIELLKRPKSGFRILSPPDLAAALRENEVDAIVSVPRDAEAAALATKPVQIRVRLDRSRQACDFTLDKLEQFLKEYEQWVLGERLRARGVPVTVLRPLETVTEDVATGDRRMGSLLAVMLPMMLLLTGMLGAFFPALNATTTERELGTLEALLVTPAGKMELLLAKGALVLLSALFTAGVNMLSMSLVLWRSFSMMPHASEALSLNPGALALAYLAAVPTLVFFAAAVLVVGLFARNYREANAYATPVMLLSMVPMLVSITDPKVTPGLLLTPTVNTTLIIRDVLTGHVTVGAYLLAFASSCLYAGLMLSLAARLFTTEQLVNPAWEPLSLKGLRTGSRRRERRLPAVDEALALYAVTLLLLLYASPFWSKWGLLPLLAGNELLLIAAPALLFAWAGRLRWVETFAWRRPTVGEITGAALMGVGLLPWVYALSTLQERIWPEDPEVTRAMLRLLYPALKERPLLTALGTGLLAGVCEELLYRGPLQTALLRRLPVWFGLGVGAVLFAAAHMDLPGMLFRTLLGLLLGWIVWRGGSIFPAMVMHAVIDATHLGILAWILRSRPVSGTPSEIDLTARAAAAFAGSGVLWLGLGAALLVLGSALYRFGRQQRPAVAGPIPMG